jgi:hypothetical protein
VCSAAGRDGKTRLGVERARARVGWLCDLLPGRWTTSGVSTKTPGELVKHIYTKLGISTPATATVFAMQRVAECQREGGEVGCVRPLGFRKASRRRDNAPVRHPVGFLMGCIWLVAGTGVATAQVPTTAREPILSTPRAASPVSEGTVLRLEDNEERQERVLSIGAVTLITGIGGALMAISWSGRNRAGAPRPNGDG